MVPYEYYGTTGFTAQQQYQQAMNAQQTQWYGIPEWDNGATHGTWAGITRATNPYWQTSIGNIATDPNTALNTIWFVNPSSCAIIDGIATPKPIDPDLYIDEGI